MTADSVAQDLCLHCGLCCDGTLFKDVELQAGDNAPSLAALGLPLKHLKAKVRFPQPCAALCADLRCRIYAGRPARCHEFECALFKAVANGRIKTAPALKLIRTTRQRAEKVRNLLRALGDQQEDAALSVRFRRMTRRMESTRVDEETADTYGLLTLAVHDLNLLLGAKFYPGDGS